MGGVKNLQVVEPSFSSLKVRWDPAVGNVRSYQVFYTADPGGETQMVGSVRLPLGFDCSLKGQKHLTSCQTGGGFWRHHQHHPEEPGS